MHSHSSLDKPADRRHSLAHKPDPLECFAEPLRSIGLTSSSISTNRHGTSTVPYCHTSNQSLVKTAALPIYIYSLSSFIIIMAPAASRDRNDTTLRQCNKLHLLLVPARQKLVTEGCLALHRDSEGKERVRTWTVPLLARSCRESDFLCRSPLAVS